MILTYAVDGIDLQALLWFIKMRPGSLENLRVIVIVALSIQVCVIVIVSQFIAL